MRQHERHARRRGSGTRRPITLPDFPPVPAYDLINRYIGYQPTPDIFASFSIDNLLNKYYVQYMNAEGQSQPAAAAIIFRRRHHGQGRADDALRRLMIV